MAETDKTCSLCEKSLDTTGYPLWCKSCRTEKKRALKEAHEAMANGKGFAAGCEQFRRALLATMLRLHPAQMTPNAEIAKWIAEFPAPRP